MNGRLRKVGNQYYTLSLVPNQRVYGERLETTDGKTWREWNPFRSKLAAALGLGLKEFPIRETDVVLYLGCAEGTTVSHVSDLVGEQGVVFGLDVSPKAMANFSQLAESRTNIIPILADARDPLAYASELSGFQVNVIVQDIAQRDQSRIFLSNMHTFGKPGTKGLLVIKARSVDFAENPQKVFEGELKQINEELEIIEHVSLGKFEKDHFLISCMKT